MRCYVGMLLLVGKRVYVGEGWDFGGVRILEGWL